MNKTEPNFVTVKTILKTKATENFPYFTKGRTCVPMQNENKTTANQKQQNKNRIKMKQRYNSNLQ